MSSKGNKRKSNEQGNRSLSGSKRSSDKKSSNDNAKLNKQQLLKPRRSVFKQQRKSDFASRQKQQQLWRLSVHDWRQKRPRGTEELRKRELNARRQQLPPRHWSNSS